MTHAIEVEGLVKRSGETRALAGIDLQIRRASVFGILGPNGAGKTTTIRILATLLRPDAGRAVVLGHDVVREAVAVRSKVSLTAGELDLHGSGPRGGLEGSHPSLAEPGGPVGGQEGMRRAGDQEVISIFPPISPVRRRIPGAVANSALRIPKVPFPKL